MDERAKEPATDELTAKPSGGEVRYPLPQYSQASKRGRRIILGANLFMAVVAVWNLIQGNLPLFPILALAFLAYSQWRVRRQGRDAVADSRGIRGPHLRKPIAWAEVAQLEEPLRYDPQIFVTMKDGSKKGTGFPASYFEQLRDFTEAPVNPKPR